MISRRNHNIHTFINLSLKAFLKSGVVRMKQLEMFYKRVVAVGVVLEEKKRDTEVEVLN